MLRVLMANIEDLANDRSCEYITLTASSADHIPLFEQYGFVIEDNPAAQYYLNNGLGVPMEKHL